MNGLALRGVAWRGVAWHGTVRHGLLWFGREKVIPLPSFLSKISIENLQGKAVQWPQRNSKQIALKEKLTHPVLSQ